MSQVTVKYSPRVFHNTLYLICLSQVTVKYIPRIFHSTLYLVCLSQVTVQYSPHTLHGTLLQLVSPAMIIVNFPGKREKVNISRAELVKPYYSLYFCLNLLFHCKHKQQSNTNFLRARVLEGRVLSQRYRLFTGTSCLFGGLSFSPCFFLLAGCLHE